MNILKKADEIVNQRSEEKERQYGPFGKSMEEACALFNAMTHLDLKPEHMFKALIALKLSREGHAHKEDNLLDAAAYIGALNNYLESKEKDSQLEIDFEKTEK